MDKYYNLINTYFVQITRYFYNFDKLKPVNPTNEYIENYKNTKKFKKLPLIYTNPKWDKLNKRLIWNSFDQELELAKKRHVYNNLYWYYNKYPCIYLYIYPTYNKKHSNIIFQNPRWNDKTKKLEWNIVYRK
jgi:hypothetical protein